MSSIGDQRRRVIRAFAEACKAEGYEPTDIEPLHIAMTLTLALMMMAAENDDLDEAAAILRKWTH
jgi:hypothetical protein